jgi:two-component system sensor histidine kinase UhpB
MLQRLSLRARLLALLGAVLATGVATGVALLMLHAAQRVRAESDSTARLAREFAATALASLAESEDPVAALRALLAEVERLRHIRIYMEGADAPVRPAQARRAPAWFAALVAAPPSVTRIRLDGRGRLRGELVLAADPGDEIDEIWDEAALLALGAAALALAGFAIVSVATTRALAPLSALGEAVERLRRGERALSLSGGGAPELVAMAARVEALAATLARLDEENSALVARLIHVQDAERRDIARDLHDEIGPFLFSIRAGLGALARGLDGARRDDCLRIDGQIAALQQVNRRILGRLRPASLDESGLGGALEALARGWRELHPGVAIRLRFSAADAPLDETITLAAYRIAQEGLTNVFRHSGATQVDVEVERIVADDHSALRIAVRDDGAGVEGLREGLGLRGMSERVVALGGRLTLESASPRGALLEARLPLGRLCDAE